VPLHFQASVDSTILRGPAFGQRNAFGAMVCHPRDAVIVGLPPRIDN
jgi:hypothetical protein